MTGSEVNKLRGISAQIGGHFCCWLCCALVAGLLMSFAAGCSDSGVARESRSGLGQSTHAPATGELSVTPLVAPAKKVATRSSAVRTNGIHHFGESLASQTVP